MCCGSHRQQFQSRAPSRVAGRATPWSKAPVTHPAAGAPRGPGASPPPIAGGKPRFWPSAAFKTGAPPPGS
jgi:hypothetical protein